MENENKAREVLAVVTKVANDVIAKIKKADKRMLIMVTAAAVLVIIILALIIHGVSAGKDKENTSVPSANIGSVVDDGTTEDNAANYLPQLNSAGKYIVETGSGTPLNMRIAADRSSQVLAKVPNGTVLEVLFVDDSDVKSDGDYGWGYVEYQGERGWVFMEYLKAE